VRLNEIAARYAEQVDFYCVYIQEAHPEEGWQVAPNIQEGIVHHQHRSAEDRAEMAQVCSLRLNLRMPLLLDTMDDEVDLKYNALPERLYLLDAEGRVAYKSVAGSFGFDPEAWARAIAALVGATAA